MQCAIYCRLSKEDGARQGSESESIQNQKSMLLHYAAEREWPVSAIYADEDYSGADRLRPGFNQMLEAARQGQFQILLCKSQSRFTRDMELVERYLHGLFPLWGVRFIAVTDNADTQVRGNKKARQINGLVNEWYLEDLSENIRMVLDHKRREGQYIGSIPLYGYCKDPADKNRLLIDPPAAAVVGQIFHWALAGWGQQSIARKLNEGGIPNPTSYKAGRTGEGSLWSKTTVWRILGNEMYTGVMVQGRRRRASYKSKTCIDVPQEGWFRVEGTHEAIVDRATFEAVQGERRRRTRSDGRGEAHLLAGRVRCMDCGSTMSKTSNGQGGAGQVLYLRCRGYAGGSDCSRHSIRLQELTDLVCQALRRHIRDWDGLGELELGGDARRVALEGEGSRLGAQLERRNRGLKALYLDRAEGVIDREQFVQLNQDFLAERQVLAGRLAQVDRALARWEQDHSPARAQSLLELEEVPRELVALLVERVEVGERDPATGRQAVEICWAF